MLTWGYLEWITMQPVRCCVFSPSHTHTHTHLSSTPLPSPLPCHSLLPSSTLTLPTSLSFPSSHHLSPPVPLSFYTHTLTISTVPKASLLLLQATEGSPSLRLLPDASTAHLLPHRSSCCECMAPTDMCTCCRYQIVSQGYVQTQQPLQQGRAHQTPVAADNLSSTNLYIRGLPQTCTDEDLVKMCNR